MKRKFHHKIVGGALRFVDCHSCVTRVWFNKQMCVNLSLNRAINKKKLYMCAKMSMRLFKSWELAGSPLLAYLTLTSLQIYLVSLKLTKALWRLLNLNLSGVIFSRLIEIPVSSKVLFQSSHLIGNLPEGNHPLSLLSNSNSWQNWIEGVIWNSTQFFLVVCAVILYDISLFNL